MEDLVGKVFGSWTVIEPYITAGGRKQWFCRCSCGSIKGLTKEYLIKRSKKEPGCRKCNKLKGLQTSEKYIEFARSNLYRMYKFHANKRSINFNLDYDTFVSLTSGTCFYCGKEPQQQYVRHRKTYKSIYMYNGIDRLDNSIGYTIENCVTCCKYCNFTKRDRTCFAFVDWVNRIYSNLKNKGIINE